MKKAPGEKVEKKKRDDSCLQTVQSTALIKLHNISRPNKENIKQINGTSTPSSANMMKRNQKGNKEYAPINTTRPPAKQNKLNSITNQNSANGDSKEIQVMRRNKNNAVKARNEANSSSETVRALIDEVVQGLKDNFIIENQQEMIINDLEAQIAAKLMVKSNIEEQEKFINLELYSEKK